MPADVAGRADNRTSVFAREGDYWTVVFGGRVSRLRDAKGMQYLGYLLTHPGDDVPAVVLAGFQAVEQGDAGPVLDDRAVRSYRRRIEDLRDDLAEAERFGDIARADKAQIEMDALVSQLRSGLGLGGRQRRAGSPVERARLGATKAIRAAMARIRAADPALGEHLDATIRTGTTCCYRPDPQSALTWRDRVEPAMPTGVEPSVGRPARLVGRAAEFAALCGRVTAATAGEGAIVLLGGDPGIGKTALVQEVMNWARDRGLNTLVGRCVEAGATVAYLPFVEIVESLLSVPDARAALSEDAGDLARLAPVVGRVLDVPLTDHDLPADQARRALFSAVDRTTQRLAAQRPRLVVVEDLHWADEGTLAMLEHLAGHSGRNSVLIVATHRLAEAAPGTSLAHTIERLMRQPHALRISLDPLSPNAVGELLVALHGGDVPAPLVTRLVADSGGNPLFICQLYQHLAERGALDGEGPIELPETLRLLLHHRVGTLSAAAREILTLTAVAGTDVDERLLGAAGAPAPVLLDALDEAVAARLLLAVDSADPEAGRYRFVHALVGQALLDELTPARRRRLHLRLADATEAVHGDSPAHAITLADHLVGAGPEAPASQVVKAQERAARRLMEVAAHDAALRRVDWALAHCPTNAECQVASLLATRGDAYAALGRLDDALTEWKAGLVRAGRAPSCAGLAADLCERLGRSLDLVGNVAEAAATARRGLELAGDEPSVARGRLLATLAHPLCLLGDHSEATRLCEEAECIAASHDDLRLQGEIRTSAGLLSFTAGDHEACVHQARDATSLLVGARALWSASLPASMAPLNALYVGDVQLAEALMAETADLAVRAGHPGAERWWRRCRASIELLRTGDVGSFATQADEDVATCRANRLRWLGDALVNAGIARAWVGNPDAASRLLDEAAALPHPPVYIGRYSSPALVICAWEGDETGFRERHAGIERQLHDAELSGRQTMGTQIYALSLMEALALLGDWRAAAGVAPQAERAYQRGLVLRPSDLRLVAGVAALAAAARGDHRLARRRLEEAYRLAETLPHHLEHRVLERFASILP